MFLLGHSETAKAAPQTYEIINLYDAFGDEPEGMTEHFGFSALIRYGDTTILFDAGTSADILTKNAAALGVDLADVDFAVASHAHADHTGGFDALTRVNPTAKIYMPNDFFGAAAPLEFKVSGKEPDAVTQLPESHRYFGGASDLAQLHGQGRFYGVTEYVDKTTEIAPGIRLVATTSTNMGYFSKYPGVDLNGEPAEGEAKFKGLPELTLSLTTPNGQVLVVGCSHSGIETIVKTSKQELKEDVALVAGGFHLLPYDRQTLEALSTRLKTNLGVKAVAPAHCTGHLAFVVLQQHYADHYRFFGLGSRIAG